MQTALADLPTHLLASECERLVLGQTYLVPCVNGTPIVGDPHTDDDHFNRTPEHWHIDSRFDSQSCGGSPQTCGIPTAGLTREPRVRLEPRVCVRESPRPWTEADHKSIGFMTIALTLHYANATAKCGRCPHKGMPIQNGICTGHRLQWNDDGSAKVKGPFTIRIQGTENVVALEEGVEYSSIRVPITHSFTGDPVIELLDGQGEVVARGNRMIGSMHFTAGDSFVVNLLDREGYK
jgi:hypothetical protein